MAHGVLRITKESVWLLSQVASPAAIRKPRRGTVGQQRPGEIWMGALSAIFPLPA
jgi:hypothetical protein